MCRSEVAAASDDPDLALNTEDVVLCLACGSILGVNDQLELGVLADEDLDVLVDDHAAMSKKMRRWAKRLHEQMQRDG